MPGAERPPRVGVFGGTFDPPHNGHLAAARAAVEHLDLDRLLLTVANDPWQKTADQPVSPAADRLALAAALAEEVPRGEVSDAEIRRGGPSYTVDTVEELRADLASADPEIWVVVGADLVPGLGTWHRAADLARLAALAVVTRPGAGAPDLPPGWRATLVPGVAVDVSSSAVRRRLAREEPVDDLVPPAVVRCITRLGLYAVGR